jgi:hypothetical protein
MNKTQLKKHFKNKFDAIGFKTNSGKPLRLLAVQLNGFNHTVFTDTGTTDSSILPLRFSLYTNMNDGVNILDSENLNEQLTQLFNGFGHLVYKHNPVELVFIKPEQR